MTKGKVTLPWRVVAGRRSLFITVGGPKAHDNSVGKQKNISPKSP
jgi:hypothetical protein